jgi:hypothetical protein
MNIDLKILGNRIQQHIKKMLCFEYGWSPLKLMLIFNTSYEILRDGPLKGD